MPVPSSAWERAPGAYPSFLRWISVSNISLLQGYYRYTCCAF